MYQERYKLMNKNRTLDEILSAYYGLLESIEKLFMLTNDHRHSFYGRTAECSLNCAGSFIQLLELLDNKLSIYIKIDNQ